ncbi:MAG: hypothetical protein JW742_02985 [Candidatus Aminicenantes bacterium]|nr:hypothetical protein [Candidatus Aminicenantes bacterium]
MRRVNLDIRKGMGLVIVILVLAFLLGVGITVIAVTQSGPEVSGNIRLQQQALQAAEAGFDAGWQHLTGQFADGVIADFTTLYRTTYGGASGLDDPISPNYFRRLTDRQLIADVLANSENELFADVAMPGDSRFAYTVFLIDDEVLGAQDETDCILVCIGRGPRDSSSRIEVEIALN